MTDSGKIVEVATKKPENQEVLMGAADEPVRLIRFANRVPLVFQQSACAISKAVIDTNWKNYGLQQPRGALPIGPMVIFVHFASVWVPFTSEAKEAIASYDEILEELRETLFNKYQRNRLPWSYVEQLDARIAAMKGGPPDA